MEETELILKFMGFAKFGEKYFPAKEGLNEDNEIVISQCKYDSEWNWIMPVWRKFLKEISFELENKAIREDYKKYKERISDAIYACCIKTTFKELYLAIGWANVVGFTEIYEE